jgi:hypothetical protein
MSEPKVYQSGKIKMVVYGDDSFDLWNGDTFVAIKPSDMNDYANVAASVVADAYRKMGLL